MLDISVLIQRTWLGVTQPTYSHGCGADTSNNYRRELSSPSIDVDEFDDCHVVNIQSAVGVVPIL